MNVANVTLLAFSSQLQSIFSANQNIPPASFALKKRGIMGKGQSEEWNEKHSETRQTQPQRYKETESSRSSGSSCPKCCLQTRDCLMSPECGRALQISSVVAFCGSCIRMWMCKKIISRLDDSLQYITLTFKKGLKCFRFVLFNIAKLYLSTARSFYTYINVGKNVFIW